MRVVRFKLNIFIKRKYILHLSQVKKMKHFCSTEKWQVNLFDLKELHHFSGKGQMLWMDGSEFFRCSLHVQASALWWNSGMQTGSGSPAGRVSEFCGGPGGTMGCSAAQIDLLPTYLWRVDFTLKFSHLSVRVEIGGLAVGVILPEKRKIQCFGAFHKLS